MKTVFKKPEWIDSLIQESNHSYKYNLFFEILDFFNFLKSKKLIIIILIYKNRNFKLFLTLKFTLFFFFSVKSG